MSRAEHRRLRLSGTLKFTNSLQIAPTMSANNTLFVKVVRTYADCSVPDNASN